MKRNQELMKLTKYLCHALTLKDMDMCQMMEFIRWLVFINIVLKKIVIKNKRLQKKKKNSYQ